MGRARASRIANADVRRMGTILGERSRWDDRELNWKRLIVTGRARRIQSGGQRGRAGRGATILWVAGLTCQFLDDRLQSPRRSAMMRLVRGPSEQRGLSNSRHNGESLSPQEVRVMARTFAPAHIP